MKTIIKFPIYVEIETDNIDRAVVVAQANKFLYPRLIEFLSSKRIKSSHLQGFRELVGQPDAQIRLFTENELFKQS